MNLIVETSRVGALFAKIAAGVRSSCQRAVVRQSVANKNRRGLAAIEFALTLPLWVTIILGVSDGTYYMLINEKVDRIAYSVSDIVSQYQDPISLATLKDTANATSQLMNPYVFGANGIMIVSSVYKPAGLSPTIKWQYVGGGSLVKNSLIGSTGGTATLPNGLTMVDGDSVVITEVYYNFKTLFVSDSLFPTTLIYQVAMYRPRMGPLLTTPS